MARKVMRTLKTGGQSLCSSPDDKVGRGRCNHVLDDNSNVSVNINKEENCVYIEVQDDKGTVSIKAKEEKIAKFIGELSKGLPKEQAKNVMDSLR